MNYQIMLQFVLLLIFPYSWGQQTPSTDLLPFMELNQIHRQYLHHTSTPEVAHLLRKPPFTYWTQEITSTNISHLLDSVEDISLLLISALNQTYPTVTKCSEDLTRFLTNFGSKWAIQMIDAYGKVDSGLETGNVIWPGSYKECISAYAPPDQSESDDFHGQYCVASWQIKVSQQIPVLPVSTGVCVPNSCDADVLKNTLKHIGQVLGKLPVLNKVKSNVELLSIKCKGSPQTPDAIVVAFICLLFLFLLLVLIGSGITAYDKLKLSNVERHSSHLTDVKCEASLETGVNKEGHLSLERSHSHSLDHNRPLVNEEVLVPKSVEKKRSCIKDVLLCFCAFTNAAKILNTDVPSGQLRSLHGIRFLSLTWVIMGHSYISAVEVIENKLEVLKAIDNFPFQMVLQAPFSVDSFFLLSGFLVTYLYLKEMKKTKGKMNWIYFYIHRFWRLTPVYMVVVLFYILCFKYFGSGPFWDENHGDSCRHTIWWYLLYISNFIPVKDMCVGWSWYLGNDMQFYVISPLFLYPLWRWPKAGLAVICSLLCGSWVTTAVLSYQYNLIPMFVGVTEASNLTEYQDNMWFAFDMIYDKPYCRIGPYLIGAFLAYILYKIGNQRQFLNWYQQLIGWTLAIFCSASVVFGLYHVDNSLITGMFYNALCRSSFAIGLAWIIFICEIGQGGVVYKLLSLKFWVPLSRLTYSAYLVHLMIIHGYYQGMQVVLYFTQMVMVTNFFGFISLGYILAFFVSVIFESPMLNLEKLLLKRQR